MNPSKRKVEYYRCDKGIIYRGSLGHSKIVINKIEYEPKVLNQRRGDYDYWYFVPCLDLFDEIGYNYKTSELTSHWELIDASYASDKIPLTLSLDNVKYHYDEEDGYCWGNHQHIQGLYKAVKIPSTTEYKKYDLDLVYLGIVHGDVDNPITEKFSIIKSNNYGDKTEVEVAEIIHYGLMDELLTPNFALHMKPCMITSENLYQITRSYIKDHIDPKVAIITSDYDFCLSVEKVLLVPEIMNFKKGVNAKEITQRYKVYETSPAGYQKYPTIRPIYGDDKRDLIEKIKAHLKQVIDIINAPIKKCECCNGVGMVVETNYERK